MALHGTALHWHCTAHITSSKADILNRTNIKDQILDVMDEEIEKNKADNPMLAAILPMLKAKVSAVIDERSPELKAMLYCTGLAKLFVLELGPLLTSLLLAGRIGGSFAGEVGTMEATNQNRRVTMATMTTTMRHWWAHRCRLPACPRGMPPPTLCAHFTCWVSVYADRIAQLHPPPLVQSTPPPPCRLLKNLGISTRMWSLVPTVIAALIAAPILTAIGTAVALWAGSVIVEMYNLGSTEDYWDDVYVTTLSLYPRSPPPPC